jgi:hypothetical protein
MKKILFTIVTAVLAFSVQAQTVRTSYFMDKHAHRHQRNPALSPSMGYINFPALGNFYVGLESNLKLSKFLYPLDNGELGTYLHEDVDAKKALKKFSRHGESANLNVNWSILGFGFYTKENRFWSADLNVKVGAGMNIPKDVFGTFKNLNLGQNGGFEWDNLNIAGRGYLELAIGHARDVEIMGHNFRMGAKIKPLVGLFDGRFMFNDFSLKTSREKWTFNADADVSIAGGFLQFKTDSAGKFDGIQTALDADKIEIMDLINFGAAFDFGAVYNMDALLEALLPTLPLKGFTASIGITDLGFIKYKKSTKAGFAKGVDFTGLNLWLERNDTTGKNDWKTDAEDIFAQFDDIMSNLDIQGEGGKVIRGLRSTLNIGLEYSFLNDKMSAGLLWSTHFGLPRRFSELTLSYNLRPVRWYSFSLSTSIWNGFFRSAGWAMNFTPKYGLNFFFGMDYVPFAYTMPLDAMNGFPVGLPIHNLSPNFNFGMTIPLGGNRSAEYGGTKKQRRAARYAEFDATNKKEYRRAKKEQKGFQQSVQNVYQSVELGE